MLFGIHPVGRNDIAMNYLTMLQILVFSISYTDSWDFSYKLFYEFALKI